MNLHIREKDIIERSYLVTILPGTHGIGDVAYGFQVIVMDWDNQRGVRERT